MIGKSRRMQAKLIGAGFQFLNFLCVDFSLLATTHSSGLGTPEAASTVKRTKAKCESSRSFAACQRTVAVVKRWCLHLALVTSKIQPK